MSIDLSRREFLEVTAAGVAGANLSSAQPQPAPTPSDIDRMFERAFVVDAICDEVWDDEGISAWKKSGLTCILPTLSGADFDGGMRSLKERQDTIRKHPSQLILCTKAADIERAKREGKLAILCGFQRPPLGRQGRFELDQLDKLHAEGTRWIQLTHNERTLLADGGSERANGGLSDFGVACIERMNQLGIIVDLSHVGETSTAEAIAISQRPPCFTHTFCQALRWQSRGKPDYLLRAVAERGGVAGMTMVGWFITPPERSLEKDGLPLYIDHIVHAVKVCGMDHVALSQDRAIRGAEANVKPGDRERWLSRYTYNVTNPPAPGSMMLGTPVFRETGSEKPIQTGLRWPHWIPELDKPERYRTIAHALTKRGFTTTDIEKILGANWVRYFRDIFKG